MQCVKDMYEGVKKLLEIEKAAVAYVLLFLDAFSIFPLVRSTPDGTVGVRALAGVTTLFSSGRYLTLDLRTGV